MVKITLSLYGMVGALLPPSLPCQDPLLEAAQLVVEKRLVTLQSRERELQTQVRAINRQLVHAEANKDVSNHSHNYYHQVQCSLPIHVHAELARG